MSPSELKNKWRDEAEKYRMHEVGSGTQKFAKDVLAAPEIFNLKTGKLSTPQNERKGEFTEETKTKAARKADMIIYISPEIVIPVEVERHGEIEKGAWQLRNYQADLEKQYGILTDGYEWRFYNNNLYRTFIINEILDDPQRFRTFWEEYTQPLNYYINFFEPVGQQKLFKNYEHLPVEDNRALFFEDITKLIRRLKDKFNLAGYLNDVEPQYREKKSVELTYAYVIQFILYKTLVDNNFGKFEQEFQARTEEIKNSLQNENYKNALVQVQAISDQISHNIYRPFAIEQEIIAETVRQLINTPKNSLNDVAPWLDIFVFIKKYSFANVKNDIFGYIYENYLKELYSESNKGQYFTDPAVVNFMLDAIGYTPTEIRRRYEKDKQSISLIDPSCGSGTFLYSATDRIAEAFHDDTETAAELIEEIVNENIFGLDIEEFPLYLAEMNILMRLLPYVINERYNNPIDKKIKVFWTKDSLSEFLNTGLRNTLSDASVAYQSKGNSSQQIGMFAEKLDFGYTSYVRDESDLEEMKKSLENQPKIPRSRFDYVIGNPPYIGYNASSKLGILYFDLLKKKEQQLNSVYGVNLHSAPKRTKKYSPKPNLYAFFVALGLALLKDNGKLCYIIPQTLLTAGDLDVLRYHLAKFTTIEQIIIPDSQMFIGRGIKQTKPVATSSLILMLRRAPAPVAHEVEVTHHADASADIETCLANIASGRNIRRQKIMQNNLLANVANWNFLKQGKEFLDFYEMYKASSEDMSVYYNHARAQHYFGSKFYFDGGALINNKDVTTKASDNSYEIFDYKHNNYSNALISTAFSEFYPADSNFEFAQGSQGIVPFLQPYKIIWRTKEPRKFQFTDRKLLLVNNQSLMISSTNLSETYYLLAVLNSKVTEIVLLSLLKLENEQSYLLPIKSIKEFVRVPRITDKNQKIKDEIIKQTEVMLALEGVKLADLVNFSGVMQQKFDSASVEAGKLVLTHNDQELKLATTRSSELVASALASANFGQEITLAELKNLPALDKQKRTEIKNYVDDLVFALYFNIALPSLGLANAGTIRQDCAAHKLYKLVNI